MVNQLIQKPNRPSIKKTEEQTTFNSVSLYEKQVGCNSEMSVSRQVELLLKKKQGYGKIGQQVVDEIINSIGLQADIKLRV